MNKESKNNLYKVYLQHSPDLELVDYVSAESKEQAKERALTEHKGELIISKIVQLTGEGDNDETIPKETD